MPENDARPIKHKVVEQIYAILEAAPAGKRFEEIVQLVLTKLPNANRGSIGNWLYEQSIKYPDKIMKPARGLYVLSKHLTADDIEKKPYQPEHSVAQPKEEDFYEPFANYLVNDLEECTKAIGLGGNKFGGKWGTPDVIGKWQSSARDIIKVPTEVVSAEIKTDTNQLITAFGQACAYRLFSHKVYLVVPKTAGAVDIARLEALCLSLGIGLVLFNKDNSVKPDFQIRVRAIARQPDNFYLNENIANVEKELFG